MKYLISAGIRFFAILGMAVFFLPFKNIPVPTVGSILCGAIWGAILLTISVFIEGER